MANAQDATVLYTDLLKSSSLYSNASFVACSGTDPANPCGRVREAIPQIPVGLPSPPFGALVSMPVRRAVLSQQTKGAGGSRSDLNQRVVRAAQANARGFGDPVGNAGGLDRVVPTDHGGAKLVDQGQGVAVECHWVQSQENFAWVRRRRNSWCRE